MRVLALDVGSRTIGLALSDPQGVLATAWEVISRRGQAEDAKDVLRRALEESVGMIVVGLPLELDGSKGHRARLVHRFTRALAARLEAEREASGRTITMESWDERFSTAAAERTLIEADVSRARRKKTIDALAAQFILQGWLDARARRDDDRWGEE